MSDFISYGMTDDYILTLLGQQFKQMRINAGFSQDDLADISGLSRKTISSIEKGHSASTGNIIALLRGLKQFDLLSSLYTPSPVSPIAAAKTAKAPKRVRSKKATSKIKESEW